MPDASPPSDEIGDPSGVTNPHVGARPLGFLDALKTSWGGGRGGRAQPASGTDAQARAVNYIDQRERTIGSVLGVVQILVGVWQYSRLRHLVVKASTKPRVTVHRAHLDTIYWHHFAIYILVVNLVLGVAILGAVLWKRRAIVGVMVLLGGFGLTAYGGGILGIIFLGVGAWLIFRGRKMQAGAATPRAPRQVPSWSAPRPTPTAATRKPPPPSKRYTPPQARVTPVAKKSQPEEKKPSRLSSWVRR